jgi:hypothetical protein
MKLPKSTGPIMPACTTARRRQATLYRGRDAGTRYAPPPPAKTMTTDAAIAAASRSS